MEHMLVRTIVVLNIVPVLILNNNVQLVEVLVTSIVLQLVCIIVVVHVMVLKLVQKMMVS